MAEHANAKLTERGYRAFADGDLAALSEIFAPDIVWHQPGTTPIAGVYKGREDVFGFFGKLAETTGGTFRVEVQDILADDQRAVALQRVTGKRDGKTLDMQEVVVFEIRDGIVTEVRLYTGDPHEAQRFWS